MNILHCVLQLSNGFVNYTYGASSILFDDILVNDGKWHYIQSEWTNRGQLTLTLDYGQREVIVI